MSIPRIVHFTWKTRDLPRDMKRLYDKWRSLHPDWDIRLYTDEDMRAFVAEHFPAYLALFDGYPRQIQRVDAFRYFVLSRFGGLYADLDVDPLRPVDELLERADCFVTVEPERHSAHGPDGMRFQLCNALMGSVPDHPFWLHVFDWLERCKDYPTLTSTGPRMLNGAGLTAERAIRPTVLAADFWSPIDFYGRRRPAGWEFQTALGDQFSVIGQDEPAITSHLWNATWTGSRLSRLLVNREKGPGGQWYNLHNRIKWRLRKRQYPQLDAAADLMPRIEQSYGEQMLEPYGEADLPKVAIAIDAEQVADPAALTAFLLNLDYPRDRLTLLVGGAQASLLLAEAGRQFGSAVLVSTEGAPAKRRNTLAEQAMAYGDFCLFVDGHVVGGDPKALRQLLAARRPVVSANCGVDGWTFRYDDRAFFKRFYRDGITNGAIGKQEDDGVSPLDRMRYLRIAPLDVAAATCLLVDAKVLKGRVRFAERGYMFHGDGGGFAILARQSGFEVCGLPEVRVHLHAPKGVKAPKR